MLPLLEKAIPSRLADYPLSELESEIVAHPSFLTNATEQNLENFLAQPEAAFSVGKVLYPRFYAANEKIGSQNPWAIYDVRPYPRIGFVVLGREGVRGVILPTSQTDAVHHGQFVAVIGCSQDEVIEARLVFFIKEQNLFFADDGLARCRK
ncbi:MAG: hypothetical protein D6770_08320 [Anaerolineae bacterium]|nr:MAG: hypothetical protein D6770_08320 [Anaerolineae bacterium]